MKDMSFVSYAQNFEDVMLWRALKHVERGFYVDVGACSPDDHSITRAFYEHGWRGINIEANPTWKDPLEEKRPEDLNLLVGLGKEKGEQEFHLFGDEHPETGPHGYLVGESGMTTASDEALANARRKHKLVRTEVRPVLTLNHVWEKHISHRDVHFLKVDVEGMEAEVLQGNNWAEHRPWIVVIEATKPGTDQPAHESWESILLDHGYRFVYFDGLNRFYVASEHSHLSASFSAPPNYSDSFITVHHANARKLAKALEDTVNSERQARVNAEALTQDYAEQLKLANDRTEKHLEELSHAQELLETRSTELADARRKIEGLEPELDRATQRIQALAGQLHQREKEVNELQEHLSRLDHQVHSMANSKSWRITAPLRVVAKSLNGLKNNLIHATKRRSRSWPFWIGEDSNGASHTILARFLVSVKHGIDQTFRLNAIARYLFSQIPGLESRLRRLELHLKNVPTSPRREQPPTTVSAQARRIYLELLSKKNQEI